MADTDSELQNVISRARRLAARQLGRQPTRQEVAGAAAEPQEMARTIQEHAPSRAAEETERAQAATGENRNLPAFYHQHIEGRSQAELLEMRDRKRSEIPREFSVRQWRQMIRGELQDWARRAARPGRGSEPRRQSEATRPEAARPEAARPEAARPEATRPETTRPETTRPETARPETARPETARPEATRPETARPEATRPEAARPEATRRGRETEPSEEAREPVAVRRTAGLSDNDRQLLNSRLSDVIDDPEAFRRRAALQRGEHPDTGETIDVNRESQRGKSAQLNEDSAAIVDHAEDQPNEELMDRPPGRGETAMDTLQLGLDAVGVVEPTPIADGTNAAISLVRAATDKERRKEHLQNAAISTAGVIPYVGDLAKLAKIPRAGKTVRNAARLADGAGDAVKATDRASDAGKATTAAQRAAKAEDRAAYRRRVRRALGVSTEQDEREAIARGETAGGGGGASSGGGGGGGDASGGSGGSGGDDGGPPPDGPQPNSGDDPQRRRRARDESVREMEEEVISRRKASDKLKEWGEKITESTLLVGKMVGGYIALYESTRLVNKGNLAYHQHLEEVNADVARAMAIREIAGVRRDIRQGRAMAPALTEAAEADTAMEDVRERFTTPIKRIGTDLSASFAKSQASLINFADTVTGASKGLNMLADGTEWLTGKMDAFGTGITALLNMIPGVNVKPPGGGGAAGTQTSRLLDDMMDGKLDGKAKAGDFFSRGVRKK